MTMNDMKELVDNRGEYQDFIGSYSNFLDSSLCKYIIDTFDYYQNIGAVFCGGEQFDNTCAGRFDWSIDMREMQAHMPDLRQDYLNDELANAWNEYSAIFGNLRNNGPVYSLTQKVQKTPTGGGYHMWHDENGSMKSNNRVAVWMLYLNDDFEGGETEFLYYKKRIKAERGKLLIWPAGYTHCHKGNMVLSGNKYIVTGWFYGSK
jgi:hypothetical protein